MQMSFNKIIGKNSYRFTVEGNNLFDLSQEAQKVAFYDVYKCGLCGSDKLNLRSYITEKDNYKYVKISCADCGGQVTFGQPKKSPDTFYLRKNEDKTLAWEVFKENGNGHSEE